MVQEKRIFYSSFVKEIMAMHKALKYLPADIKEEMNNSLTILTMTGKKATRLSRGLCESSEIIILAEDIFPPQEMPENHPDCRFFIFIVLHEIAHAYLKHKCQVYDRISDEEKQNQEDEADSQSATWYNQYVVGNPDLNLQHITAANLAEFRQRIAC